MRFEEDGMVEVGTAKGEPLSDSVLDSGSLVELWLPLPIGTYRASLLTEHVQIRVEYAAPFNLVDKLDTGQRPFTDHQSPQL
jgi:hypothetical protein